MGIKLEATCWNVKELESFKRKLREPILITAGYSNVGKSSFINVLTRSKVAYVAKKPGKTVSLNLYTCRKGCIVDLPGYGFAKVSRREAVRFSELVERFLNEIKVDVAVLIVDIRRGLRDYDVFFLESWQDFSYDCIVLLNKVDKLSKSQKGNAVKKLAGDIKSITDVSVFPISAQTGEGIDKVLLYLKERVSFEV